MSLNSQVTAVLDGKNSFSVRFCDNSLLHLAFFYKQPVYKQLALR